MPIVDLSSAPKRRIPTVLPHLGQITGFDISSSVRLINTEEYGVNDVDTYYGFLSGICAGNYDVTDIFCDATLKITGRDYDIVVDFLERVSALAEESNVRFTFTLSCDESELPDRLFMFAGKI